MEEKHLEMFIRVNLKYKSQSCTLLVWSLRSCTRKCSVGCGGKQGQNIEKHCPRERTYFHQTIKPRRSESVLCYRYIVF